MNARLLLMTLCLLGVTAGTAAEMAWEDRPFAPRKDEASEWWCTTWRTGQRVEMVAKYQLAGKMLIRKQDSDKVRWCDLKNRFLDVNLEVDIQGTARTSTAVLYSDVTEDAEEGITQLLRTIEAPISVRAVGDIGLQAEKEKTLRTAFDKFVNAYNSPEVQAVVAAVKYHFVKASAKVLSLAFATVSIPVPSILLEPVTKTLLDNVHGAINDKARELQAQNLEALAGSKLSDGGAEVKPSGLFRKKFAPETFDDLNNLATTLNQVFTERTYFMSAEPNEPLFVHTAETEDEMNVLTEYALTSPETARDLQSAMAELPREEADQMGQELFSREVVDVNETLFDSRSRAVGDVWNTDAILLNNYLHPDLNGQFSGTIVLKYDSDETKTLTYFDETKTFNTRHLVMLERYRGRTTKITYTEPGTFNMTYDASKENADKAALEIWVDKASGHVVKVSCEMTAAKVEALPGLKLLQGFTHGEGALTFTMDAEASPSSLIVE